MRKEKVAQYNRKSFEKRKHDPAYRAKQRAAYHRNKHRPEVAAKRKEAGARYKRENKPAVRIQSRKDHLRAALRKYGLSLDDYATALAAQNGVCAICGGPPNGNGRFHIDHCHATNRFRGLLCHSCNVSLGHFKDSPELLRRAADYLEKV